MKYEDVSQSIQKRLRVKDDRFRRRVLIPLGIVAAAFFVLVLLRLAAPNVVPVAPQERIWSVSATTVAFQDIRPQQSLFGQVIAGRETELRSLVAGTLIETGANFRDGGIVKEGEFLVQIDPFEYQAAVDDAKARVRESKARLQSEQDGLKIDQQQLEIAERDLARARQLHEKGTVSRAFLDDAERGFNSASWAVTSRAARVEIEAAQAQQRDVALRRAQRDLRDTKLIAPFDGYVSDVNAERGKRVSVNDRIALMSGSQRLEVKFNITDAQYGRILDAGEEVIGRNVTATWRVGGRPLVYDGTVVRVGAQIEAQSGGVDVFAVLNAATEDIRLRPGAFVELQFPDRAYVHVAQLPEGAVYNGHEVYVVVDGRLLRRDVELAGYTGDNVFVKGDLEDGALVLTTRFPEVGEGVLVEVRSE
ncbi:MAG: efflux RND transporter periplasmic adaptor subunit [Proteobacteria bacterium]|nr:efflux RND transporter periplasmic adaptor subunit [Pseudomonadota bacterium]